MELKQLRVQAGITSPIILFLTIPQSTLFSKKMRVAQLKCSNLKYEPQSPQKTKMHKVAQKTQHLNLHVTKNF